MSFLYTSKSIFSMVMHPLQFSLCETRQLFLSNTSIMGSRGIVIITLPKDSNQRYISVLRNADDSSSLYEDEAPSTSSASIELTTCLKQLESTSCCISSKPMSKKAAKKPSAGQDSEISCAECQEACLKLNSTAQNNRGREDNVESGKTVECSSSCENLKDSLPQVKRAKKNGHSKRGQKQQEAQSADEPGKSSQDKADTQSHGHEERRTTKRLDWTLSEDVMLKALKDSSHKLSWAAISKALNRDERNLKARWNSIRSRHSRTDDTDAEHEIGVHKPANNPGERAHSGDTSKDGKGKYKGKRDKDWTCPGGFEAARGSSDILSGEEGSSESSDFEEATAFGGNDSFSNRSQLQKSYFQRHIFKRLYPETIKLVPDEHFGERDCDILASAHSKLEQSRWLDIQATFYNTTGRWVPAHILRGKFEAI